MGKNSQQGQNRIPQVGDLQVMPYRVCRRLRTREERFLLSAKKWIILTNTVGLKAKDGRYGNTYAHQDKE